jgi:hypothetical protein
MSRVSTAALALGSLVFSWCGWVRVERSAHLSSSKEAYEQRLWLAERVGQYDKGKAIYDADLAEYEARQKTFTHYGDQPPLSTTTCDSAGGATSRPGSTTV